MGSHVHGYSFNPCFSGFTSTTACTTSRISDDISRFNPCFSGFTSTTASPTAHIPATSPFQSLFFWIHFYNPEAAAVALTATTGFNPCFSGFTSTTLFLNRQSQRQSTFQSLFFWIHFYNSVVGAPPRKPNRTFQSLFFWIHFYNPEAAAVALTATTGFNPCFSGFTSTTGLRSGRSRRCGEVSILVFLDSLLQLVAALPSSAANLMFQSLFFWIHFYNSSGKQPDGRPFIVSILVFLDSLLQPHPR